jgi:hypothetical protein
MSTQKSMSSRGRRLGGRENIGVGGEPPWREPWSMGAARRWRRRRRFSGGRRLVGLRRRWKCWIGVAR